MNAPPEGIKPALRKALPVLLPVVVLGAGALAFAGLSQLRPARPDPTVQERSTVRVKAVPLAPRDVTLDVIGHGTSRSQDLIQVGTEVGGRVAFVEPRLRVGSFVSEGDVLVRLADDEMRIAQQVAQADARRLEAELARLQNREAHLRREAALRKERVALAENELARAERLKQTGVSAPDAIDRAQAALVEERSRQQAVEEALDLYPHDLARAKAMLASAKAALARADLNLERCTLRAPITGQVRARQVDQGQVVAAGTPLVGLSGFDVTEVPVQLSYEDLVKLAKVPEAALPKGLPVPPGFSGPSPATVTWSAEPGAQWEAVLARIETVDTSTRTIPVVVEVRNPWANLAQGRPPLLSGAYCTVRLQGKTRKNAWVVPERALREGDRLYLLRQGKLAVVSVRVDHLLVGEAVITPAEPIQDGDALIVSRIAFPVPGMTLERIAGQ